MPLIKYKLGDLIQESFRKNSDLQYDVSYVRGISNNKQITETKADVDSNVIHKFYIVNPGEFVYNPRTTRMGNKLGLGYNNTNTPLLFSFNNIAFYIKEQAKKIILPEYLYMFFNRSEFDRYAMINGWGSATELFGIDDMYDVEIDLPPLSIQQRYVDIYLAMCANQKSYESGLEDLKLLCDAYIEHLKLDYASEKIGPYIQRHDVRNGMNGTKNVMGISTIKEFRIPTAKVNRNELSNYKVVKPRQFGFVQTTHNEKVFAYAFNNTDDDIVISSVNEVFSTNEEKLLPEYLAMFFNRKEFDRYARFHSWGSARETFNWDDLTEVKIPIAPIVVQKAIADFYTAYKKRKKINDALKEQIKNVYPILIQGSIDEAR